MLFTSFHKTSDRDLAQAVRDAEKYLADHTDQRGSSEDMPTRSLTDVDRELRKDPEYEAALEELEPYEQIARQLIAFRTENGLSQAELARRCGISQPAIARLERGEHEPRLATLRRVAHALNANLELDFSFGKGRRRKHLATL